MNTRGWFVLGTACCCAAPMPWACAQKPLDLAGPYVQSLSIAKAVTFPPSVDHLLADYSRNRYRWISNLQQAGVIDRSLPKPYRVAVPLMSFGDTGPKVKLTYARNMPNDPGTKGVLIFITMKMP